MLKRINVLGALLCLSLAAFQNSANGMDQNWQKKRIERNIEILQQQLGEASKSGNHHAEQDLLKQIQKEYEDLDQLSNPARALPGAVHDKGSHLYEQQTKGDEAMAKLKQAQHDQKWQEEKAARIAEEERLSKIELDKLQHAAQAPHAGRQEHEDKDREYIEKMLKEEEEAIAKQRAEHEERDRRYAQGMHEKEHADIAKQRKDREEQAKADALRMQLEHAKMQHEHAMRQQSEKDDLELAKKLAQEEHDEQLARKLEREEQAKIIH
jgi:hypothetical protein